MIKYIRWYHHLFLWAFKNQYTAEQMGEVIIAYRYKIAFGKVYVLEERAVTGYGKSMKFNMNP